MPPTTSRNSTSDGSLQASSIEKLGTPSHLENNLIDNKNSEPTVSTVQSKLIGCCTHLSTMRLELLAFIFTFSYTMTEISSTTMILDKVCYVHFGYNESICDNLENFTSIKTEVDKLGTIYNLGHSLIQMVPAAVLSCFVGPWSDHYGRKFPMVLAIVGMIIDAVGSAICAYNFETRVEYFFIPAIFTGIFGGSVCMLAIFYSYASDCTPDMVQRTLKYAFVAMATGFAIPFGSTAGGWIYKFLSYTAVFLFSVGGLCLSLIILLFLLEETRGLDNDDAWSVKLRQLFSCKSFIESFQAVIKDRPHKGRKQIILLIISLSFLVIALGGTGNINYLFAHKQFTWNNTVYSTITSVYSVVAIVLLIIIMPLLKRFKVQDSYLGLVGSVSLLGMNIGISVAYTQGIYHAARLFGSLGGCAAFAARARISKVVSNDDLGKVFSFVAAFESLLPIVTSVLMSLLFTTFIDTFPGMPYAVLSICLVLPLGVFCWIICLPKMSYEDISHTQKTEELQHPHQNCSFKSDESSSLKIS